MLVTFLYVADFVLYNDAQKCHALVCIDETCTSECQRQGQGVNECDEN